MPETSSPLSYVPPADEPWRKVVKWTAWGGVAWGATSLINLLGITLVLPRILFEIHKPPFGNRIDGVGVFAEMFIESAGSVLFVGSILYLKRSRAGRTLFLWASALQAFAMSVAGGYSLLAVSRMLSFSPGASLLLAANAICQNLRKSFRL